MFWVRPILLYSKIIFFSDESTFNLTGYVTRHNRRYWSNANPNDSREAHTQREEIIGPFFIEGNLHSSIYVLLLHNHIVPAMWALAARQNIACWYSSRTEHQLTLRVWCDNIWSLCLRIDGLDDPDRYNGPKVTGSHTIRFLLMGIVKRSRVSKDYSNSSGNGK